MKLFLGVTPKALKDNSQLKQVYGKLKRTVGEWEDPVRWTPPDMWHVTVLFLGEQPAENLARIEKRIDHWQPPPSPNELSFQGLGAFPSHDHGRVLWVGVRENKAFLQFQAALNQTFMEAGIATAPEHEFRPHLTLARFRHARHLKSLIELAPKTQFGREPAEELVLFESVVENHMAKYIPRFSKKLSIQ
jgi:2'-5' RNA ligase